jgi:hypothetical protein
MEGPVLGCVSHTIDLLQHKGMSPIRIAIKKYVCQRTITTRKQKGVLFLSCGMLEQ